MISPKKKKNDYKSVPTPLVDRRSLFLDYIPTFSLDLETATDMQHIVERGFDLSCDIITHPKYWQDQWTQCPICGVDIKGELITHRNMQ